MAWRIDEQLIRGEIDNRAKGRVTGRLWFVGLEEPVALELEGNPWRDLAGHLFRFSNPSPKPGDMQGFSTLQQGTVGDITASRKVRVPDCPMEEFIASYKTGRKHTFHWANCLYLEWFSECNGRVVVESVDYAMELDGSPAWHMDDESEQAQRMANQEAITDFMGRLSSLVADSRQHDEREKSDLPTSEIEAEAQAHTDRMNLLFDRIDARMRREGLDPETFDEIWEEEREKLRIERGEPAPEPPTPEQVAQQDAWIDEMNAVAEEAMEEMARNGGPPEPARHPLQKTCAHLGMRLFHETQDRGWIPEEAPMEHPLHEVVWGVQLAGTKLAGALNGSYEDGAWPPNPLFAGDSLVRLKKARNGLRDALDGLDAADDQRLADPAWRSQTRAEIGAVLAEVERLISEVRRSLEH